MAEEEGNNLMDSCTAVSKNILTMMRVFGDFFVSTTHIDVIWHYPDGTKKEGQIASLKMMLSAQYRSLANAGIVVNWRGEYISNTVYQVGDGVMCNGECWVNSKMNNSHSSLPSEANGWKRCSDECCCINEY